MKLTRKKPCNECPFRKGSIPGWLGPWTADTIVQQAFSDYHGGLACHKHAGKLMKEERETGNDFADEELHAKVHVCVGALQSANVSAKSFFLGSELRRFADAVGKSDLVMSIVEFLKHHKGGFQALASKAKKKAKKKTVSK